MNIRVKLVITIMAFILFLLPASAFASTLTLSPGGGSIPTKGTYSVQVRLNTGGEAVNGVSAFLSYPADKLEVAGINPGSAFAIEAEKSYGGGIIKISRGNINGVSGNVNVATIAFRGKSPGSATVSFIGGSAAPRASDSSDSLNLGGSRGGVYTVVEGGGGSTKSSVKSGKTAVKDTVSLSLSDILVTDISTSSATITWKTNTEADSLVEYGLEKDKYFLSSSNGKLVTDHTVTLENAFLTPGVNLHFRIKSKDTGGQEAIGEDQELQLLGYTVKIKVTDETGNPLSGVEVLLYSDPRKAVTNTSGEAIFENMSPGKHLAVVKAPEGERSTEIQVTADQTIIPEATIRINKVANQQTTGNQTIILALTIAGIIVVLVVTIVVIIKRRRKQSGPPQGGTVVPPPIAGPPPQPTAQVANPQINPNVTVASNPPYINSSG